MTWHFTPAEWFTASVILAFASLVAVHTLRRWPLPSWRLPPAVEQELRLKPVAEVPKYIGWVIQVLGSLAVLTAALSITLSNNYGGGAREWASGIAGAIVGYWLNPRG